jgi:hypothetical protein
MKQLLKSTPNRSERVKKVSDLAFGDRFPVLGHELFQ